MVFYVYVLFDAAAVPRYVGMGRGSRWTDHEKETNSYNRIKQKFIKETLIRLGEVPKIKISERLPRSEAILMEIALISAIGRIDLKTGPLTNLTPGGDGGDFGQAVRQAKQKWTKEKRKEVSQKARDGRLKFLASLTPEERTLRRLRQALVARKVINQVISNPQLNQKRIENIKRTKAARTAEQKDETRRKLFETRSQDERRRSTLKGWVTRRQMLIRASSSIDQT